ncbi:MAG: tetratricopeptide repeat-containing sulfotransferase family protein [Hyphomicrobiales bacterium]
MSQSLKEAADMFQAGRLDDAERRCQVLMKTHPNNADAHYLMGLVHERRGGYEDAVESFQQVIKIDPRHLGALVNAGGLLATLERGEEAIDPLRKALRIDSNIFPARYNLARAYNKAGQLEKAVKEANKAWQLNPNVPEVQFLIGEINEAAEKSHEAIEGYQKCVDQKPDHLLARLGLARNLHQVGEFESAADHIKHALKIAPENPQLHLFLCQGERPSEDEAISLAVFEKTFEQPGAEPELVAHLCFAAGDILDRQENYDEAFSYYRRANELRAESYPFERALSDRVQECILENLTSEFFEQRAHWGSQSEKPVFIVGMPRSGTTLAEQKLAAHPDVFGMGEVDSFSSLGRELSDSKTLIDALVGYDEATVLALARQQLMLLPAGAQTHERAVNKMPSNYLYLGLIAVLFPRAKIIHCRRNIMDSSFSCYQQNFKPGNLRFTHKFEHLGRVAAQYLELMEHYRNVLPMEMFELDYEKMVDDPEYWTNAMYEFVGVDPAKTSQAVDQPVQAVKTASIWQVRQPVYTSSVEKWRRYERHLLPLAREIGVET